VAAVIDFDGVPRMQPSDMLAPRFMYLRASSSTVGSELCLTHPNHGHAMVGER